MNDCGVHSHSASFTQSDEGYFGCGRWPRRVIRRPFRSFAGRVCGSAVTVAPVSQIQQRAGPAVFDPALVCRTSAE